MFGIHNINNQIHEPNMKFAKTRKLFLNKTMCTGLKADKPLVKSDTYIYDEWEP